MHCGRQDHRRNFKRSVFESENHRNDQTEYETEGWRKDNRWPCDVRHAQQTFGLIGMIQDSTVNINNVFFKGSYKHAWKKIIPPGLTEAEVDFIEEMCGIKNSGHVLDLMCGYGRHS